MDKKNSWKKRLIIFKYTLSRGYAWCQMPTLAIIGAGVIKPYLPMFDFWQLGFIAISTFFVVGFIDRKLKLLHIEQSYGTEVNPLLMQGLFPNKNKLQGGKTK